MVNTIVQRIFLSIFIFTVIILFTSCIDEEKIYWGVDHFQEIYQLEQNNVQNIIEVTFISNVNSDNYKIKLFYPKVKFEPLNAFSIKDSILRSLDGFNLEVYDAERNILLDKRIIDYKKQGHRKNFFLEGRVLSLLLITKLSVENGNSYKLKMIIPPMQFEDDNINNPIIGGGIAPPVFP